MLCGYLLKKGQVNANPGPTIPRTPKNPARRPARPYQIHANLIHQDFSGRLAVRAESGTKSSSTNIPAGTNSSSTNIPTGSKRDSHHFDTDSDSEDNSGLAPSDPDDSDDSDAGQRRRFKKPRVTEIFYPKSPQTTSQRWAWAAEKTGYCEAVTKGIFLNGDIEVGGRGAHTVRRAQMC